MSKPICIRIDTDILDKVRAIAKDQDRSLNYIINQISHNTVNFAFFFI